MLWWFIYDDMYICIHGIIWEFMNMNEIVRLLECFNMMIIGEYSWNPCDLLRWTCIDELHVLWYLLDYAWFVNTWIAMSLMRKML